jgi:hypothetical protein
MNLVDLLLSFTLEFYKIQFKPFLPKYAWMKAVSTTKIFTDLWKNTRRVDCSLFKGPTRRFVQDKAFREWLLNFMSDPKKELGLWFEANNFEKSERQALDLGPYGYVGRLQIADYPVIRNLTMLSNLQYLYIRNCTMFLDMELLSSVASALELKRCPHLVNFQNLRPIKSLTLTFCDAADYKGCERASGLWMESCNIKDVSTLGDISILNLTNCNAIEDVDSLTGNKRLVLEGCNSVREINLKLTHKCKSYKINIYDLKRLSIECEIDDLYVSAYNMNHFELKGTVVKLELHSCFGLHDYSTLADAVIHLKIEKTQMKEVSNYTRLKTFDKLWGFQSIKKITNCPNLEEIDFSIYDTTQELLLLENLPKCKKVTPKCKETTVIRGCPLLWI